MLLTGNLKSLAVNNDYSWQHWNFKNQQLFRLAMLELQQSTINAAGNAGASIVNKYCSWQCWSFNSRCNLQLVMLKFERSAIIVADNTGASKVDAIYSWHAGATIVNAIYSWQRWNLNSPVNNYCSWQCWRFNSRCNLQLAMLELQKSMQFTAGNAGATIVDAIYSWQPCNLNSPVDNYCSWQRWSFNSQQLMQRWNLNSRVNNYCSWQQCTWRTFPRLPWEACSPLGWQRRGRKDSPRTCLTQSGNKKLQSWALPVFFHFFNNRKLFFCTFYKVNNLFLHQSYLKSPLPVELTWWKMQNIIFN